MSEPLPADEPFAEPLWLKYEKLKAENSWLRRARARDMEYLQNEIEELKKKLTVAEWQAQMNGETVKAQALLLNEYRSQQVRS